MSGTSGKVRYFMRLVERMSMNYEEAQIISKQFLFLLLKLTRNVFNRVSNKSSLKLKQVIISTFAHLIDGNHQQDFFLFRSFLLSEDQTKAIKSFVIGYLRYHKNKLIHLKSICIHTNTDCNFMFKDGIISRFFNTRNECFVYMFSFF